MKGISLLQVRWPATPVDGQSLSGLIVATAGENSHSDIGSILSFAQLGTFYGLGRTMRLPEAREALAYSLRQPLEVVETRANKLVAPIAGMDTIDFFGARVPAFDILYDRRRVGDTSKADFHHKAAWQFIHLPVDVDDGSVVVDRCQSCGARLGWRGVNHAGACGEYKLVAGADLHTELQRKDYDCGVPGARANDQPDKIGRDSLDRIGLLCRLIDPRASVHQPIVEALHPDLRSHDRGIVFYLGMKLGRALGLEGKGARLRRAAAAPFDEAVISLAVGSDVIAGWPSSVAEILKEKATVDPERAMAAIEAMRATSHGESAWPEHRDLIARAMPEIVSGHYQHVIRRLFPDIVDGREAARIIGIRSHSMAKLIRNEVLIPVISRGTAKTHGSFRLADVQTVAAAVKDSVEATELVEDFGFPLHGVEQLICIGRLKLANHKAVEALHPKLRVTKSSKSALEARLRGGVAAIADGDELVPLRKAVLEVGGREKPWGAILSAMIEGRIRFIIARPAGRLIDRIDVVRSPELNAALNSIFDRGDHPGFAFAEVMRQRDAIELLNIDPSRYQDVAKHLPPSVFGPGKTLIVDEILKVAGQLVDAREAKQRWGIKLDRLKMLAEGVGWDRRVVEEERKNSTLLRQAELTL